MALVQISSSVRDNVQTAGLKLGIDLGDPVTDVLRDGFGDLVASLERT